jgi:predicted membrane-bound spermidine synthase
LFQGARWLSLHGPAQPGLSFAFDASLSALLVLPGAALMGATIPILTQALSRGVEDSTRIHAAVYGLNTLGAFVGALSASYVLIPALGLIGTLRAMALVNLLAGAGYVLLSLRAGAAVAPAPAASASTAPLRLGVLAAVACLLGFAMMTLQTALIRMGSLALGASLFTFATVVAVFVLCIALGSLLVGLLPRIPAGLLSVCAWLLFLLLALLYLPLQDAPYYAHRLRIAFHEDTSDFIAYHASVLGSLLLLIGPAVALSGAMLPLCFDRLRRERGELGDAAGRLYGWNTAGSLCGALIGGYLLFHWLDLHHVYRVALLALAAAATLLSPPLGRLPRRAQPALLLVWAAVALALLPPWDPQRLGLGAFRKRHPVEASYAGPAAFTAAEWEGDALAFFDDDPTASISVREGFSGNQRDRSIVTNGKPDSAVIIDYPTTALLGLVPAWLAQQSERAFVVGYGTGVTAGELAQLDDVREVVVAEISPAVLAAAPLFDYGNHDASKNPRIRVVQGDAYRVLLRSAGRYDVIVSEPSNPWVTGIEMLYSQEFLSAAKQHLAPGGVYCQWFHSYESSAGSIGLVLRTYAQVFDHVAVWYGLGTDLLLLGFDDPRAALDLPRLVLRAQRPDFRAGFRRAGVEGVPALLAHELWPIGVLHGLALEGPLHTLMHPRLSYVAAQAFFAGHDGDLPFSARDAAARAGAENSLLRRYARAHGGLAEGEWQQAVSETCERRTMECATLLAAWRVAAPVSSARDELERGLARAPRNPLKDIDPPSELVRLLGDGAEPPASVLDLARFTREESARFVSYYHHAAPFERSVLAALYARCEATSQVAECREIRRIGESLLGPLGDGGSAPSRSSSTR